MWDALYKAHYPELLRYCLGVCGHQETAEDLAQEVFLKALQNADTFEDLGPSQRRAWLFRALKNLICDKARRAALEERYRECYPEETVAEEDGFGETENQMVLARLSDQDRALFQMRYIEGYSAQELAELFGLPPGTVRAKLSRCRKQLKTMLED